MCVYACVYVCMYVCMYVFMRLCVSMCEYVTKTTKAATTMVTSVSVLTSARLDVEVNAVRQLRWLRFLFLRGYAYELKT